MLNSQKIGIVLDDHPRMMMINTLVSQNLPSILEEGFGRLESDEEAQPFDGEIVLDEPVSSTESGTVIIDNENRGFEIQSVAKEGYLKKLINFSREDEDDYIGIRFWNIPKRWRATASKVQIWDTGVS